MDVYSPLSNMHENYGFYDYSFGNLLTLGIIMFSLSYTMFHSISFFSDIVPRIISGVPNRLTSMGNLASSVVYGPKGIYNAASSYGSSVAKSFYRGLGRVP